MTAEQLAQYWEYQAAQWWQEVIILKEVAKGKMWAPKVPNPEAFDGSSVKIWGFLTQLELKLQGNPEYQDEKEQKRLFFSLLKGRVLTWAFPYIRGNNGKPPLAENLSMGELTQKLYDTFGDPDPKAKAEAKLMKLHQGG